MTFTTQVFENLQNVNQDNMNLFYLDKDEKLTAYFEKIPCICSGVGKLVSYFGQSGTSNSFTFVDGLIRFMDQPTVLSSKVESTFAELTGSTISITASTTPPAQLYVVAVLTQTQLDAYKVTNSVAISSTAMTLAQIAAQSNPLHYVPLFAITNTAGVYHVSTDANCIYNYLGNYYSGYYGDSTESGVRILADGSIEQWGTVTYLSSDGGTGTICNFPMAFPNRCFNIIGSDKFNGCHSVGAQYISTTQFKVWGRDPDAAGAYSNTAVSYRAIGW